MGMMGMLELQTKPRSNFFTKILYKPFFFCPLRAVTEDSRTEFAVVKCSLPFKHPLFSFAFLPTSTVVHPVYASACGDCLG